ncbi:hypothetical protein FRC02_005119 [Tulasnella sp. 418]|nr:hypothetical protein FRC02_005119 [Tulasnella sp. 418]
MYVHPTRVVILLIYATFMYYMIPTVLVRNRVGSYSIENRPIHPDYVGYLDAIADDFVVRCLPVYTRSMARMLDPTEYSRIVGCTVLVSDSTSSATKAITRRFSRPT